MDKQQEALPGLWTKPFITVTLSNLFLFLNLQMITTVLPAFIAAEYAAGSVTVSWVISIFALVAIATRFYAGNVINRLGKTRMLTVGLIVYLAATASYYWAGAIALIMAVRIVYGVGFGLTSTAVGTLASDIIPQKRIGEGMGYFGLSSGLSMSLAPVIGLAVYQSFGFDALILVSTLLVAIVFPLSLTLRSVRGEDAAARRAKAIISQARENGTRGNAETPAAEVSAKAAAASETFAAGSVKAIAASGTSAAELPAKAAATSGTFAAGSVKAIAASETPAAERPAKAAAASARGRKKLIDKEVLLPCFLNLFFTVTYGGLISFLTMFGKETHIANVGWFFLFNALAVMLVRPFSGKLFDRRGPAAVLPAGALFVIGGLVLLSYSASTAAMIAAAVCYGIGYGILQPSLQAWTVKRVGPERRGAATGMFYNSTDLGIAIGSLTLGIIATQTSYATMYRLSAGFLVLFLVVYALSAFGRTAKNAGRTAGSHL